MTIQTNFLETSTQVSLPITYDSQPRISIQVGLSSLIDVNVLMDTGSAWLVLNESVFPDDSYYTVLDETYQTVTYGGGDLVASGPICSTMVSLGGLEPKAVKFLLKKHGNYGGKGTLGINTWRPDVSVTPNFPSELSIPMQALGIDQYQISLSSLATECQWVLNAYPAISAALNASSTHLWQFDAPSDNNAVVMNAILSIGSSHLTANLLLDSGTPGAGIHLFTNVPSNEDVNITVPTHDNSVLALATIHAKLVTSKTMICGVPSVSAIMGNKLFLSYLMGIDLKTHQVFLLKK